MSFRQNFDDIMNAVKERGSVKKAIGKINKQNDKEQEEEMMLNSVMSSMSNIFFNVQEQAKLTNIELQGFTIQPHKTPRGKEGTINDPIMFIEYAKRNKNFNKIFNISSPNITADGHTQYKISLKKLDSL